MKLNRFQSRAEIAGDIHELPNGWHPFMGAGQSIFENHKNAVAPTTSAI
jgi:hypothetical protein